MLRRTKSRSREWSTKSIDSGVSLIFRTSFYFLTMQPCRIYSTRLPTTTPWSSSETTFCQ
jgi:hypothetical protein